MAEVAKALGDPIRLQLVDVLRKHAGKVCVCELVPLFDLSQPTLSHHLKKLRDAGIVDSERQGLWAYYYVRPDALKELTDMAELTDTEIRETVRERYAAAAEAVAERQRLRLRPPAETSSCCGTDAAHDRRARRAGLRRGAVRRRRARGRPRDARSLASLGCGDPTAVADLHAGETVLDLGSGGGTDVLHLRPARRPDRQGLSAST